MMLKHRETIFFFREDFETKKRMLFFAEGGIKGCLNEQKKCYFLERILKRKKRYYFLERILKRYSNDIKQLLFFKKDVKKTSKRKQRILNDHALDVK